MPGSVPLKMGNSPPAHLFVVRHGSRLDAADKSWHLTSPTPYDPPLTYGGFLQARQVGNHIAGILQQANFDAKNRNGSNDSSGSKKKRRFKVVIHSSPFLRCVQTSIGISSGLAQAGPDLTVSLGDLIVPRAKPQSEPKFQFKSTLLRLDSFLGEWLSPEYFEMITPPPGSGLMLGGAKAELLRREDYSIYADIPEPKPPQRVYSGSLWQSPTLSPSNDAARSPSSTDSEGSTISSSSGSPSPVQPEVRKGYIPPRPIYAVSSSGSIPEGFVAHSRDACVTVDYQWDSTRPPLEFGDGGKFGEEWASMHKRFRGGLRKLVNWYASNDSPADLVNKSTNGDISEQESDSEVVETVVIMVSHGAGCNALIGAITNQPVLMDIGIASITMASRKPNLDYSELLSATSASATEDSKKTMVAVDKMYDIQLSASTDHLRRSSTTATPISPRPAGAASAWSNSLAHRGRTSTISSLGGPVMSPFTFADPFTTTGSRSSSTSAASLPNIRRDLTSSRTLPREPVLASTGFVSAAPSSTSGTRSPTSALSPLGTLPTGPSSLRLMDDGRDNADGFDAILPDFDRINIRLPAKESKGTTLSIEPVSSSATDEAPIFPDFPPARADDVQESPTAPVFAAPIRLHTNLGSDTPVEEMRVTQLGGGLGGLWGLPLPPGDAERFRDMSHTKRRWTVNERA